jgi:hypothetical protein
VIPPVTWSVSSALSWPRSRGGVFVAALFLEGFVDRVFDVAMGSSAR